MPAGIAARYLLSHVIPDFIRDPTDYRQLTREEHMHQEFCQTPAAAIIVFDRVRPMRCLPWRYRRSEERRPDLVLAQVAERESIKKRRQPCKQLIMNEFWSHPPGSNRRPADYEVRSAAPNTSLAPYGCACYQQYGEAAFAQRATPTG